jgi:RNA polymerase sigma factor (sigma-70 family)
MATSRTLLPPLSLAEWMAAQEGCNADLAASRHQRWVRDFDALLGRLAAGVCDAWPPCEQEHDAYAARVWSCYEHHWRRLSAVEPVSFDQLQERFASGNIGLPVGQVNLLAEVMLAQALEFKHQKAAVLFETQYMPDVRRMARAASGARAAADVENLVADLILPRESARHGDLPPRIATYQGRTSLRSWLRAIVLNHSASESRRKQPVALADEALLAGRESPLTADSDCQNLLAPIFRQAISTLTSEDRLLVKMLALDGVPQNALAASLGIHSGSVTRRRQRAFEQVLAQVSSATTASPARVRLEECLQTLLAGENLQLQRTLAGVLATAFEQAEER